MNQSELLHAALKKAGVPSTLHVVKGGGHGFSKITPANNEIVKKVMDFFDDQFQTASKATNPPS
jgi:dipeptidyl aminopeptidase/acylaminoacyl peptidase